jgi:hypothetical protein
MPLHGPLTNQQTYDTNHVHQPIVVWGRNQVTVRIFVKVELHLVYGKDHERCDISGQRLGYVIASMWVT